MLSIKQQDDILLVNVIGQFSLDDYKQFEDHVRYLVKQGANVSLLFDFRDMLGYSIDVAWEEIRFAREQIGHFQRVAIVSEGQWVSWLAWMQSLFMPHDFQMFEVYDDAILWLEGQES
ncbi:STAS/SEC14 domain-containing protein [Leeia sp. TBRC 13508]|uniref:STAS/SEC14 domain-containing protein n=1 Tax=Leeia speluncae TaxID=2884804 RepID=A0ABS8D1U0_9NEIS|nr:STAS/SEC14 domain-containing protein [Leeia speluncae]MCB6182140.1 STAS/SEC14 domain-containing protein [Leeia speluncae]